MSESPTIRQERTKDSAQCLKNRGTATHPVVMTYQAEMRESGTPRTTRAAAASAAPTARFRCTLCAGRTRASLICPALTAAPSNL
ncbi:hypothetical protein PV721_29470 [Streptomyces sp. MB09-01]|uniref:hypothetical protein n=1 Tax=Streptomyces sp. MB09-01 TaxID=3028666 RepID=UPI0029AF28A2|nr:hypothetical protein [Streptomyces sp. MB09-01]MDX3538401.1 hypothetical protein [Streptomyces sp. MB09-01]